ncbi:MAG: HNH endonuclease [Caldilineales bacterium]|nr:HNH endonuclease [Caldilineales bacterium]
MKLQNEVYTLANRCAICRIELTTEKAGADDESLVGDECHIVARQEGGPRGEESLPVDRRDDYNNLILLCKNHHKQVDDQRNDYTVKKLQYLKKQHESWVREKLEGYDKAKQQDEEIYAAYVVEWEKKASLDAWVEWTSGLLAPVPSINREVCDHLVEMQRWLLSRVWPQRYVSIENAFRNFGNVLADLLDTFFRHVEKYDLEYMTIKFYTGDGWNPFYFRDLDRYEHHVDLLHDLTFELTRAANYICDRVREEISPTYRIDAGRLLVSRGDILGYMDYCPQYRGPERVDYPYPGLSRFLTDRTTRDWFVGAGDAPEFGFSTEE